LCIIIGPGIIDAGIAGILFTDKGYMTREQIDIRVMFMMQFGMIRG